MKYAVELSVLSFLPWQSPTLSVRFRLQRVRCIAIFVGSKIKRLLPPFSLIRDFGKQNTLGNVSKISVNLICYRHVGSKCANHSPLS